MTANVERLERTMAFIKAHPEKHDQGSWGAETECGTVACFAGWAAELYGEQVGYERHGQFSRDVWRNTSSHELHHVQEVAEAVLGISSEDGDLMFSAYNSRGMLELMVKDLANGEELRSFDEYQDEAGDYDEDELA